MLATTPNFNFVGGRRGIKKYLFGGFVLFVLFLLYYANKGSDNSLPDESLDMGE